MFGFGSDCCVNKVLVTHAYFKDKKPHEAKLTFFFRVTADLISELGSQMLE